MDSSNAGVDIQALIGDKISLENDVEELQTTKLTGVDPGSVAMRMLENKNGRARSKKIENMGSGLYRSDNNPTKIARLWENQGVLNISSMESILESAGSADLPGKPKRKKYVINAAH